MDIAKLLGTAGSVLSEAGSALSGGDGSTVSAVGGLFAKALAAATSETEASATAATAETADATTLVTGPLTTTAAGTEESALGPIAGLNGAESLDAAAAKTLSLALATAIVTWASQSLGSRGDDSTVTVEGRHVDSLVDDLPAALRQAIEETLAALDARGGDIPAEIMASLNAILGAVTVQAPEVTGGPLSDMQVTRFAGEMADAIVEAVSNRFDGGSGVLERALQSLGVDASALPADATVEERVNGLIDLCRASLESSLASEATSAEDLAQLKAAIDTLLERLRGTVARVTSMAAETAEPETVSASAAAAAPASAQARDGDASASAVRTASAGTGSGESVRSPVDAGNLATAPVSAFGRGVKARTEPAPGLRAVIEETVRPVEQVPVRVVASGQGETPSLTDALSAAVRQASTARAAAAADAEGQVLVSPTVGPVATDSGAPRTASARTLLREVLTSADDDTASGEVTVRRGQTAKSVSLDALERLFAPPERDDRAGSESRRIAATQALAASQAGVDSVAAPLAAAGGPGVPLDAQTVQAAAESGSQRANVMTQVENSLQDVAFKGRQEVVIELRPPHLGDVRVTLTATEQAVTAHFQAQSHTVKAILESNMYLLKDMLNNAGVNAEEIQVSVGLGGDQSGGWRQNGDQAAMYYRSFDPRHAPVVEDASVRPVGLDAGQTYSTASVVNLLA